MSTLLKNCLIFDTSSDFHSSLQDILIERGVITSIGKIVKEKGLNVVDLGGDIVSPGWVDLNANFCDPGLEHREDISSGVNLAAHSGFTDVCVYPNTKPVCDSKAGVEYIFSKAQKSIALHPIACISERCSGENMTELLDLNEAGARAFSDGNRLIANSELLLKVLQYTSQFDGLVISRPSDPYLGRNAQMHEGIVSTRLGLKGEPSISEKIQIEQQLEILRYSGGRLHFGMVSTKEGVELIGAAKKEGLSVTCDVGVNHLIFTDESVDGFNTSFKVSPPFRNEKDRRALIKGIKDDVVDAIVSGHQPIDQENKLLEFDLAEPGIISLQTVFSCLSSIQDELELGKAFQKLTSGPRDLLRLEEASISVGQEARLAVFDPNQKWRYDDDSNLSKSKNSPFWHQELSGKSRGIIIGTKNHLV